MRVGISPAALLIHRSITIGSARRRATSMVLVQQHLLEEEEQMPVVHNETVEKFALPGLEHQTLAGPEHGMQALEMWMQTIEPGSGTPVHRHDCEEAIVVLRGSGRLTVEGKDTDFGPNSTLQIPRNVIHQIVNTGTEDMFIVAALGQAPVRVCTADNEHMPLPWQG